MEIILLKKKQQNMSRKHWHITEEISSESFQQSVKQQVYCLGF